MNIGFDTLLTGDSTKPVLFLPAGDEEGIPGTPEPFGAYNTNDIKVAGYATDDVRVEKVLVNGKKLL